MAQFLDSAAAHHLLSAAQDYAAAAQTALAQRLSACKMDQDQRAAHGYAWAATSVAALESLLGWAEMNAAQAAPIVHHVHHAARRL